MKIDGDAGLTMKAVVRSMARPNARPDVVGEKEPHLVAKGQVLRG